VSKSFALVDCNNFYVSCERVFNPSLINKPVVVLSNNDGCIISRSNEAKLLNIPMGAPLHLYRNLIDANKVKVYSSNYPLYGDMSNRVMTSLMELNSELEIYSIDEAFLKINEQDHSDIEYDILRMRNNILMWTGIPVSVGLGPTKTLAKIANSIAKKTQNGVFNLDTEDKQNRILKNINVEDIWGISRRWGSKLRMIGIGTALELRNASANRIRQYLGVVVQRIVYELRGISCLDLDKILPKKNIMCSRSFGNPVNSKTTVKDFITEYSIRAAEKARQQNSRAQGIYVFLRTNRFKKEKQYNTGIMIGLNFPCSDTSVIIKLALRAVDQIYQPGYSYHKAGIMMLDLIPSDIHQKDLFENITYSLSDQRMKVIDSLNKKFGSGIITHGKVRRKGKNKWKSRSFYLSPRYTTQWDELPHAN
jgi:DNA polymerase V